MSTKSNEVAVTGGRIAQVSDGELQAVNQEDCSCFESVELWGHHAMDERDGTRCIREDRGPLCHSAKVPLDAENSVPLPRPLRVQTDPYCFEISGRLCTTLESDDSGATW